MLEEVLTAKQVAHRLGIAVATLYDWLGQSDYGLLVIRGQRVRIEYMQGGPKGQGRILIPASEIDRIKNLMRVRPLHAPIRRPGAGATEFPGITVPLGRPST